MSNYDLPKSKKQKIEFLTQLLKGQTTVDSLNKDYTIVMYIPQEDGSYRTDSGQVLTAEEYKAVEAEPVKDGDFWLTFKL